MNAPLANPVVADRDRITIDVYPTEGDDRPMFRGRFARSQDAEAYEEFWRRAGCARLERV